MKGQSNPIRPNTTVQESPRDGFSYQTYDRLTRAYVNEQGGVNYSGLKAEMAALSGFIDQLAATGNRPDLFPTEDDRKRYYLTAYNALCYFLRRPHFLTGMPSGRDWDTSRTRT